MSGHNRTVNTHFWNGDSWSETLSPEEKLLYLYLITNSKVNMLGVYEITLNRISFETGLPLETIQKALEGFERLSKVCFLENKYMILVNFLKNQKMNPNMIKSAGSVFNELPNSIKTAFKAKASKGFERLTQWFRKYEIEIELEIEVENETECESECEPEKASQSDESEKSQNPLTFEPPAFTLHEIIQIYNEICKDNFIIMSPKKQLMGDFATFKEILNKLSGEKLSNDLFERYFAKSKEAFTSGMNFKGCINPENVANIWNGKYSNDAAPKKPVKEKFNFVID